MSRLVDDQCGGGAISVQAVQPQAQTLISIDKGFVSRSPLDIGLHDQLEDDAWHTEHKSLGPLMNSHTPAGRNIYLFGTGGGLGSVGATLDVDDI